MAMLRYRGPQLLLWACTAAALQAPTPLRKSRITAKAATEGAEIPYELCCQALHDDANVMDAFKFQAYHSMQTEFPLGCQMLLLWDPFGACDHNPPGASP